MTTKLIVGLSVLVGILAYIWIFLPISWCIVATILLLWETWSLIDNKPQNTISEIIWKASDHYSLFPYAGGFIFGLGIGTGYIKTPEVIVPLALLCGHFWFPRYDNAMKEIYEKSKSDSSGIGRIDD